MDPTGDDKWLAVADFHIARSIHGKLKDRDASELKLLINSSRHIVERSGLAGVGNQRACRYKALKACIRRIENDIVGRRRNLNESLVQIARAIGELPVAPVAGLGRIRDGLAIGRDTRQDLAFAAIKEIA